jgi:ATP/maltotriose-dependent transcriptional regulator MalT
VAEHLPGVNPGLPQALHDYLAEELYQAAPSNLQRPIALLSLIPGRITVDLAHATLGPPVGEVLETAERLGFINSTSQGEWELHPLLRDFLQGKLMSVAADDVQPATARIVQRLNASERWEEAFAVIERFGSNRDFEGLLDRALSPLLLSGRVETLQYWLMFAARRQIDSALVDLAEAEVAGRLGLLARSDIHASRADRRLTEADARTPQLLLLRGRNAILRDRYDIALGAYDHARRVARTPYDQRAALWGSFISKRFLEEAGTAEVVAEMADLPDESVEGVLRLANARFQTHCLLEGEVPILDDMFAALEMIDEANDPQVITAFLQALGYGLLLCGRYDEGIRIARRELDEAQRYRLSFVIPSARSILAFCELGLGNFATARTSFDTVEREARELHDVHNTLNARVGRARILLAYDLALDAMEETRNCPPLVSPGMYGEYVGTHAIALACAGRTEEAAAAATQVERASRSFEARSTAACARAILALRTGTSAGVEAAQQYLLVAATAGHIDGLIAGYRAYHPLLAAGAEAESLKAVLAEAVRSGRDISLALAAGIWLPEHASSQPELTPREREVLHLIARGITNREAAKALFISEATVKVHVRHIFEKLGVRTRTEAALRVVTDGGHAAPSARATKPEDS